jgi:hypothetical protein
LLRTRIAIGCGYGDLANDRLDNRDLLHPIAFTNFYNSIRLLNRQRFYSIFESDTLLAADFGADKRACLARSSPGIARDALAEAMLNWRVPIAARIGVATDGADYYVGMLRENKFVELGNFRPSPDEPRALAPLALGIFKHALVKSGRWACKRFVPPQIK